MKNLYSSIALLFIMQISIIYSQRIYDVEWVYRKANCDKTEVSISKGFVNYKLVKVKCSRYEPNSGFKAVVSENDTFGCGTKCVDPRTNEDMGAGYRVQPVTNLVQINMRGYTNETGLMRSYLMNVAQACTCVSSTISEETERCQPPTKRRRRTKRRGKPHH